MKVKELLLMLLFCPIIMGYTVKDENITVMVGEVEFPVYSVEISWDSMEFTYVETVNYVWDNSNYTYEMGESTYSWDTSTNIINIDNKSMLPVDVELNYSSNFENINGIFDIPKTTINVNEKIMSKLILNGSLNEDMTNYVTVGTINLLIS